MHKDDIVKVDVMGSNYYPRTVEEVTKDYNLTSVQLKTLEHIGELLLFNGQVVVTLP